MAEAAEESAKPAKVKLTPEEKKARAEQRKAEKKRQAELKAIQLQHEALDREIKYGQLTLKRHERNWKKMLTNIALPRMRRDLKFAWHNFERSIDAKDFEISLLMDELRDSEEQYMMNFRSHSENIERLMSLFRDRVYELKTDSEEEICRKQNEADARCAEISATFAENEEYLKTMLFGLEVAAKEHEQFVRGEYLSKIDEETGKYQDVLQHLRLDLERRLVDVWNNTKAFLEHYHEETSARHKSYETLAQQDVAINQVCREQLKKLESTQSLMRKLKAKFGSLRDIQERKISDLVQERQYFADSFWILKTRLEADRRLDLKNISVLTLKSNDTAEHLNKIKKLGRHLLQLSTICRKFETLEEKIMPFPIRGETPKTSIIDVEEYRNVANLRLFWLRVAQVDAIRYSMNEEREFLKRENKILKQKIHHYCQCLECPTFDHKNMIPFSESKESDDQSFNQKTISGDQSLLVIQIEKK